VVELDQHTGQVQHTWPGRCRERPAMTGTSARRRCSSAAAASRPTWAPATPWPLASVEAYVFVNV